MTDLVERLLRWEDNKNGPDVREAADEIKRLEAKCVQVDRYIALLNDEISDNGKLRDEIERLTAALKDMFALMDEGLLVRDTSHDNDPMWSVRQLKFAYRLAEAHAALDIHKRGEA